MDNQEYIVVNKNFKNISAFFKTMSYSTWVIMEAVIQKALTEEEVDRYLLRGEGRHVFNMFNLNDPYGNGPPMVEWAHKIGLNNFQITEPALTAEWFAQYEQAAPWWRDNSPEGYGRWIQQYNPRSSAWLNLNIIKENRFNRTKMMGAMPEDGAAYGSTLDDLLTEGFTKIIVGQEPISYFDTLVANWKASGGDVVTSAINRVYGKK
jgi:putative aldouronate transport system substrate-binding protein